MRFWKIDGSQPASEYSARMFVKLTIHSSNVTNARPSRNKCPNGTPRRLPSLALN